MAGSKPEFKEKECECELCIFHLSLALLLTASERLGEHQKQPWQQETKH